MDYTLKKNSIISESLQVVPLTPKKHSTYVMFCVGDLCTKEENKNSQWVAKILAVTTLVPHYSILYFKVCITKY